MEDTSNSGSLPYFYAPLPSGNEPNGPSMAGRVFKSKPNKIGLAILCGLMISALVVSLLGYNTNVAHKNEISPEFDDVAMKVSRAKAAGVSEKANVLLGLKGLRDPLFDWNDLQLSWQRSSFHFQPQKNWMNDPNGPMYYNGWYHFFYQYNPGGAVWGDIVWGHAVSKDLIEWSHLPIAMVPDQWYDSNGVWTGSATILPDGRIMMLYTGSTNESVQVQNLAFPANLSDPLLIKWVKYSGNPVLVPPPGIGSKDFRDPTTAWKTSDDKWRITIGSKINRTGISLIYDTTDFINFELKEGVLHGVEGTGMWECVDFYPVSISESNGLETSFRPGPSVKHVLKASMDDDRQDYYALGSYDEKNRSWVPDDVALDVGIGLRYDYGGKWYASKTFYDQNKKRRVLWGWMPESDSTAADIQKGWSSVQAIPRTILYDQTTGTNLIQWPVEEVETLRHTNKDFSNILLTSGTVVPLHLAAASEIDIVAEFDIEKEAMERLPISEEKYSCPNSRGASQRGALGPFGFLVLANDELSEQTPVYFYVIKTDDGSFKTFFCSDLSRSSVARDVDKNVYGSTVPVLKGEKLSMRILVDHSIVEAYAQEGRTCITSRVYPQKAIYRNANLYLFNNATSATVNVSVKTWQMSPA